VWVGERKIGAVGVRISQAVTSHGVALNVATDLSYFQHIVPCGTPDKEVTSMQRQLAAVGSIHDQLQHPAARPERAQAQTQRE
jgi:lipoyl(octanoyl) transferase